MNKTSFSVDNASILFLARVRKNHTNSFRFTMSLREPVDPGILQSAVDRIWKRFPSVIAGFVPGLFHYLQVPASQPPQVLPDPGCLITMNGKELRECCYRVYYRDNQVSIEAFHALTDGYGAITSFTTLIAEYLSLKDGIFVPLSDNRLDVLSEPQTHELTDAFLYNCDAQPKHLPSRYAYQLPRTEDCDWTVRTSTLRLDADALREASHRHGVTVNTLLCTVLAVSVMELQKINHPQSKRKPVRIMVPADLRRLFPSKTLRNFSLYALPTMEVEDQGKPLTDVCHSFASQLRHQLSRESLSKMIAYNVRTQNALWFRAIPWCIKGACMRIGYHFFGESNSSLTLTNLGRVQLPEELQPHVQDMQVFLTPRTGAPYGCAVLGYGNYITINMSRFCKETELEDVFFQNLQAVMQA